MRTQKIIHISFMLIFLAVIKINGQNYHVSKTGDDNNPGTENKPFKTISKAAELAHPGSVITVHEGVYREHVDPPRGGSSEDKRIIYQAAEGEMVEIKGSRITAFGQKNDGR